MTTENIMKLDDFVESVLEGRKDFRCIRLVNNEGEANFVPLDTHPSYKEMLKYLKDHSKGITLDDSIFSMSAKGLYLRDLFRAVRTIFNGSDLRNSCFGGDLSYSVFRATDLRGANLSEAYVEGANFVGADLRGVKGLESVRRLGQAIYDSTTTVTTKEKSIIKKAMEGMFRVVE